MEGFAYHIDHNPFLLDSGFFLSSPMDISHVEEPNNNTNHSQFYKSHNNLQGFVPVDITINESGSCLEHVIKKPCVSNNEPCMTNKQSINSSSLIAKADEIGEQVTQKVVSPMYKRKKYKDDSSLNSANSKNTKELVKAKRQKKCNGTKSDVDDKKPRGIDKKDKKKVAAEESPTGYIHVRARRGQATDSHSLAERVRREKISDRMKQLQALVPGCDKVMGKTHMLDDIINYVQSLQNQVEFLSLKLASVIPILYEFGIDLDAFMTTPERLSSITSSQTQTNSFADTSNTFSTYNYPLMDSSSPLLLQHGQMTITLPQADRQQLCHVNNQRQDFINQSDFNNLCSFH